jgi:membrane protease YdiL (CAAX protease family)
MKTFFNAEGRLRNGWWIAVFFLVLLLLLFPPLAFLRSRNGSVSMGLQAAIAIVATFVCQTLRRRPFAEVTGRLDVRWLRQFGAGLGFGAALMLIPAAVLALLVAIHWSWSGTTLTTITSAVGLFVAVAVTEELIFRGFVFQRLIDGLGEWPAQLLMAGYFVLSHSTGLANAGEVRSLAMVNIFVASLLFGLAYLRTRSLALPIGLHLAANFTQGTILGLGVSGSNQAGLLVPQHVGALWLTGGSFGLEASLPGLITVIAGALLLFFVAPRAAPSREAAVVPALASRPEEDGARFTGS